GRDIRLAAEILGKPFRAFELRRCFRRSEIADAGFAEGIAKARDERRFGSDHDKLDAMFAAKSDDRVMIGRIEPDAFSEFRDPCVSGSTKKFAQQRAGAQSPGERVFPAARADK